MRKIKKVFQIATNLKNLRIITKCLIKNYEVWYAKLCY